MYAAVATAAHAPLSIAQREAPTPGPGEVLVRVTACGVCFTDLNLLRGHFPFARFPVVPGHEVTGVVAAAGAGVDWPAVGTAVGAQFLHDSCGHCDYCVRGDQILCPAKRITGVVVDGGYAEYAVFKAGFVTPLPDGLDPVAAAPLMCAGITAFNGLRQGGIRAGSRVAVLGPGGIGALAVRYAVAMGARVAVIGRSRRAEKAMLDLGAERYVSTDDTDPAAALKAWDGGADLVLNAAPSTAAAVAAFGGLAPDGTLVLCGYDNTPLALPTQPMVLNRLRVLANPSGSPHDLRDTLAFSAAHAILPDVTPITLDEAPGTLEAMASGGVAGRRVITF
ncbi:alcohol dehydrogenase catalytic domain-containing protein [Frankia sp. CNm7]|uniref:alcohol dehydrogenase n=1 Tax=Frankia nepalensis TaxID=1836974 RepID=A0A937RC72_9ACTN|nr:alcohol dehydrogenase catalytic domain-containing protein [Frankia nepalensis]MBL7497334.1 alcohol dehydrogenase catalytic domain-containing protein [Frankia nepalensis]MBL7509709.1 alcohol dehydrogenase catalytic domain-containing protein [Frankia nepalensis]MBL7516943.1 alcohol dehydrogenase catalytic domain-containing protein [Frankia nepalensis]MBL7629436.1 alcohol dehydrogenase catalytic domain-containing protein [Frankia nepalensis]